MRLRQIFQTTAGALLVAAALVLSAPGIQVARAGEPARDANEFARFLDHSGEAPLAAAKAPAASLRRRARFAACLVSKPVAVASTPVAMNLRIS